VLIALYIIAVVVGSISYSVTAGNIQISPEWCQTVLNIDTQAQATFNLAKGNKCLDVDSANFHTMISEYVSRVCASDCDYRGGYPHDRYWGILRSWPLIGQERVESCSPITPMNRTLNMAKAQVGC